MMNTALCIARILNMSYRRYSSFNKLPLEIVIPLNKEMIVCWHPEREFPYECSLPLPEEKSESNSILCIGEKEIAEVFKHKSTNTVVDELSKITYTTKHRWYPKDRTKRRKELVEPDRPYL